MFTIRWISHALKKGGQNVQWQRRKRAKTVNNLVICDNAYNILAISDCIDGNHHDNFEIIENIKNMIGLLDKQHIDYKRSHLNADSGFDVKAFIEFIENHKIIANIKENRRNKKKNVPDYRYLSEYIYDFRFKIEVVFAWLDTYKRLLVRFEVLSNHFKSWLLIASSMINFRHIFN